MRQLFLVAGLVLVTLSTSAAKGQDAVGPAPPRPSSSVTTLSGLEKALDAAVKSNSDRLWNAADARARTALLASVRELRRLIDTLEQGKP